MILVKIFGTDFHFSHCRGGLVLVWLLLLLWTKFNPCVTLPLPLRRRLGCSHVILMMREVQMDERPRKVQRLHSDPRCTSTKLPPLSSLCNINDKNSSRSGR